jgi:hypothetical protein
MGKKQVARVVMGAEDPYSPGQATPNFAVLSPARKDFLLLPAVP